MKLGIVRALGACLLGVFVFASTAADAVTYQRLYDRGSAHPMVFGPDGKLYGFTEMYGSGTGGGEVFQLTLPAPGVLKKFRILHTFTDPLQGGNPTGRPYFDANGTLYGATFMGGAYYQFCCNLGGTVFSLTPGAVKWKHRRLTSFGANANDGYGPRGGVTGNEAGELFGTTSVGATAVTGTDWGIIFKLAPPVSGPNWKRTLLHDFGKTFYVDNDGSAGPQAGMIMAADGTLFGTTVSGGVYSGNPDLSQQGGSVFALRPPRSGTLKWRYQIMGSVSGDADGASLFAGVVRGKANALYGAADVGGDMSCGFGQGCGTIFRVTGASPQTVLHAFTGAPNDGARPFGDLLAVAGGTLYGTTGEGGSVNKGTVFKLAPPAVGQTEWVMTILHSFAGGVDGQTPRAGLVAGDDGWFYGLTSIGGGAGDGTIFRIKP